MCAADTKASLRDACDEAAAPVPFSCRSTSCGTCRVDVIAGIELLDEAGEEERAVLSIFGDDVRPWLSAGGQTKDEYAKLRHDLQVAVANSGIANVEQIADIVVGTRQGTSIAIRDVAMVGLGQELRTGSASANGAEVVHP